MPKILLVDDSPDLAEFMTHLLNVNNFIVKTATSKQEIMKDVEEFMPDVILMDVRLNGEDGRELCKELKENNQFSHIRNVLMSANPSYLEEYAQYKADDILHKPFKIEVLIETIKRNLS